MQNGEKNEGKNQLVHGCTGSPKANCTFWVDHYRLKKCIAVKSLWNFFNFAKLIFIILCENNGFMKIIARILLLFSKQNSNVGNIR